MKCETFKLPDGMGHAIVCSRNSPRCRDHRMTSKYQCDFPVGVYKSGKKKGQKKDCNRHLCDRCVRHGVTPGVDFCPEHYPIAKAAYEKRQAK